jgi:hypothetical protein
MYNNQNFDLVIKGQKFWSIGFADDSIKAVHVEKLFALGAHKLRIWAKAPMLSRVPPH